MVWPVSTLRPWIGILGRVTTRRYHHGNLREALAEAAVEVARERGPEGLALRELARRVGVSHNAAYRHFADLDALIDVVAERGLAGLVAAMERRLDAIDDTDCVSRARRRLIELGHGYVDFAIAEPGLFRVVFTAYPEVPDPVQRNGKDPYGMLNAALDELVRVGCLAREVRVGAELTCWAAVHGFAVLSVEGPLRGLTPEDREAALGSMLTSLDRAYGATTAQPPASNLLVTDP